LQKPKKKKPDPKAYSFPEITLRQFILPDGFDLGQYILNALERDFEKRSV
jgi:hypothetical protein